MHSSIMRSFDDRRVVTSFPFTKGKRETFESEELLKHISQDLCAPMMLPRSRDHHRSLASFRSSMCTYTTVHWQYRTCTVQF